MKHGVGDRLTVRASSELVMRLFCCNWLRMPMSMRSSRLGGEVIDEIFRQQEDIRSKCTPAARDHKQMRHLFCGRMANMY